MLRDQTLKTIRHAASNNGPHFERLGPDTGPGKALHNVPMGDATGGMLATRVGRHRRRSCVVLYRATRRNGLVVLRQKPVVFSRSQMRITP